MILNQAFAKFSRLVAAGNRRMILLIACSVFLSALPPAVDAKNDKNPDGPIGDADDKKPKVKNESCTILVADPGQLTVNADFTELTSKMAGGRSATAQLTASNATFLAHIETPATFAMSPNLSDTVLFAVEFSGNGATEFSTTPGDTNVALKNGTTNITADLVATLQSGMFSSGQYRAEVVLRCE